MLLTRNRRKAARAHGVRAANAPAAPAGPIGAPDAPPARDAALAAARIGRLAAVSASGAPLVLCDGVLKQPTAALLAAASPGPLESAVGRDVVLLFEAGDAKRPIVVGWVESPVPPAARDLRVDGRRLRVIAEQELVLSCGEASITLTADGRVLIRGRGVLSHAKEQNRIRGGQVKIN